MKKGERIWFDLLPDRSPMSGLSGSPLYLVLLVGYWDGKYFMIIKKVIYFIIFPLIIFVGGFCTLPEGLAAYHLEKTDGKKSFNNSSLENDHCLDGYYDCFACKNVLDEMFMAKKEQKNLIFDLNASFENFTSIKDKFSPILEQDDEINNEISLLSVIKKE